VLTHRDSTVILDYGHNASALLALTEAIRGMRTGGARWCTRRRRPPRRGHRSPGRDPRQLFHEIYVYEDQCTRGRPDGDVIRLMREGFVRATGTPRIIQLSGELRAIGAAIGSLEPGDLLLCQVDQVELALEFVTGLFPAGGVALAVVAGAARRGRPGGARHDRLTPGRGLRRDVVP
jgi:cyanophycin synthetase